MSSPHGGGADGRPWILAVTNPGSGALLRAATRRGLAGPTTWLVLALFAVESIGYLIGCAGHPNRHSWRTRERFEEDRDRVNHTTLISSAIEAAEAAVAVHRRDQGRVGLDSATEKGRSDYVSRTDLDAQTAALSVIRDRHPSHGILTEEDDRPLSDRLAEWDGSPLWVVDPLDGTANFLHGHPQYAASVAVAVDGAPVAGAVVCGSSGERWWAAKGFGAFKGGRPISVSSLRRLPDALVGTGFPFKMLDVLPRYLGQLDRVLRSSSGVRRGGAAALDLCYLAQGSLDAFWEEHLCPWDFAAGWVIVAEAGGRMSRVDGSPLGFDAGSVMGANSPALLAALQEVVTS